MRFPLDHAFPSWHKVSAILGSFAIVRKSQTEEKISRRQCVQIQGQLSCLVVRKFHFECEFSDGCRGHIYCCKSDIIKGVAKLEFSNICRKAAA